MHKVFFAKTALQNYDLTDIDHTELVNHYIKARVVHTVQPNINDPSKNVTFVKLTDKWSADGFDTEACEKAMTLSPMTRTATKKKEETTQSVSQDNMDLTSLLD